METERNGQLLAYQHACVIMGDTTTVPKNMSPSRNAIKATLRDRPKMEQSFLPQTHSPGKSLNTKATVAVDVCMVGWAGQDTSSASFFIIKQFLDIVGPLIIESLWAKKRVSTGAHGALDDPLVVQTEI